jgi:hypothetical protein
MPGKGWICKYDVIFPVIFSRKGKKIVISNIGILKLKAVQIKVHDCYFYHVNVIVIADNRMGGIRKTRIEPG